VELEGIPVDAEQAVLGDELLGFSQVNRNGLHAVGSGPTDDFTTAAECENESAKPG
jgi:hypothetical protein